MPHRFPIFSLSQRAAEQILEQCHNSDLFELAQLSERAFSWVQNMPQSNADVHVDLSSTSLVQMFFDHDRYLEWYFYGKRDARRYELENMEQKVVVKMDSATSGESTELVFGKIAGRLKCSYCCSLNSTEHVIQFVEHICTLFNVPVSRLVINAPEFRHLEVIQSVGVLRESREVTIWKGTASHEEMRRILERFETRCLNIWCNTEPNFMFDGTISIRDFRVYAGNWFKGPMLLSVNNGRFVYLESYDITEEHLNMFLREWLNNTTGCGTIIDLWLNPERVREDIQPPKWDLDKIVQGLSSPDRVSRRRKTPKKRTFHRKIDGAFIDVRLWNNGGCSAIKLSQHRPCNKNKLKTNCI